MTPGHGPTAAPGEPLVAAPGAATGWVAHLRSGGTTPWRVWVAGGAVEPGAVEPGGDAARVPDAAALELLRRVNQVAPAAPALAGRILAASPSGRGRPDLPLAGTPVPAYGSPAVDPGDLGGAELLRIALPLLAEELAAADLPEPAPAPPARRWRLGYRLAGDPALTRPLAAALTGRGRPPGGLLPTTYVAGAGLERMLGDVWAERCFSTGARAWRPWLRAHLPELPPRIDLPAAAAAHATRWRRGRVRVVLDPAALAPLAGARDLDPPTPVPAAAADLARRVATVLALLVPSAPRRARLLGDVLRPRLLAHPGPPPAVPAGRAAALERRAARLRADLRSAGYPVVGSDALLLERTPDAVVPTDDATLALAVRVLATSTPDGDPGR